MNGELVEGSALLEVKSGLAFRLLAVFYVLLGLFAVLAALSSALQQFYPGLVFGLAFAALAATAAWRFNNLAVVCYGDRLVIRNPLVTRTIFRDEIVIFTIGGNAGTMPGQAIRATTRSSGIIVLWATGYSVSVDERIAMLGVLDRWCQPTGDNEVREQV